METGVTCGHCGGQTPLPDDLRVPTFTCRYCRQQLGTARYAGESVQVDHQVGFGEEAMANAFNPFWQPTGASRVADVLEGIEPPVIGAASPWRCRSCSRTRPPTAPTAVWCRPSRAT